MIKPRVIEYVGNLHIHSRYSDGSGTVPEIARAAGNNGLDFIILNDHAHMTDKLHLEDEGFQDGVLALVGLEIGRRYHHYLAFDIKEMTHGDNKGPQHVIDKVNHQGGFGFLAHPFERGMPFVEKSVAYTWKDLSVSGYTGICIWNFMSRWKERVKSPLHALYCLLFKTCSLKGPSKETLSLWDQQCLNRRTVAIGGSDAHASLFKWGPVKLRPFSYQELMNSINVHVLIKGERSEQMRTAKAQIYDALKEGRLFVAHDGLATARGFKFYFRSDKGHRIEMGEEKGFEKGYLWARSPRNAEIRTLRNGVVERKFYGPGWCSHRITEPGVYRVEVYRYVPIFGWRAWIFSNPIYLR